MNYEEMKLNEQKYVGIKTVIKFAEHDDIDFLQLQKDVIQSKIQYVDKGKNFLAMDSDFTESTFSYTPMLPVSSFEGNDEYIQFTLPKGSYLAFDVNVEELNPAWFEKVFEFLKLNNIEVESTGFDLEYYEPDHTERIFKKSDKSEEKVIKILFKKK